MFLGACCHKPTLCLLLEHCEHGDVQSYFARLRSDPGASFTIKDACRIAADVARALVYLHDAQSIMHRDVKLKNVLLSRNGTAKV
jgi:serine/threonine protein kinase